MKPSILVVGSSNTDMVVKAARLPAPGETVLGGTFLMNAGGKGANQAVAAARLGGQIQFIAKVGDDIFGQQALQLFQNESIDTSYIIIDKENPSGVALITVDAHGENCIVVASGANAALSTADLHPANDVMKRAAVILMQLEIPVEVVEYVTLLAKQHAIPIVLNPAPVCPLPDALLRNVSIITPNQTEAEMLTGIHITDMASAEQAARVLAGKGIKTIIITLGSDGALVLHESEVMLVPAPRVTPVDTTAAGDVFNGALVVALSEGMSMQAAVRFACQAAAISVTRMGAQASAPFRNEVQPAEVITSPQH